MFFSFMFGMTRQDVYAKTIVLSLCKTNIMIMSREDGIIMSFYFEAFPVAYQQCSGGGSLTN